MSWHQAVGMAGVLCLLVTYFLLQARRLQPDRPAYSLLNFLGAGCVLISLLFQWNLAAALIEIFWMLVSLFGLFLCWYRRRPANDA